MNASSSATELEDGEVIEVVEVAGEVVEVAGEAVVAGEIVEEDFAGLSTTDIFALKAIEHPMWIRTGRGAIALFSQHGFVPSPCAPKSARRPEVVFAIAREEELYPNGEPSKLSGAEFKDVFFRDFRLTCSFKDEFPKGSPKKRRYRLKVEEGIDRKSTIDVNLHSLEIKQNKIYVVGVREENAAKFARFFCQHSCLVYNFRSLRMVCDESVDGMLSFMNQATDEATSAAELLKFYGRQSSVSVSVSSGTQEEGQEDPDRPSDSANGVECATQTDDQDVLAHLSEGWMSPIPNLPRMPQAYPEPIWLKASLNEFQLITWAMTHLDQQLYFILGPPAQHLSVAQKIQMLSELDTSSSCHWQSKDLLIHLLKRLNSVRNKMLHQSKEQLPFGFGSLGVTKEEIKAHFDSAQALCDQIYRLQQRCRPRSDEDDEEDNPRSRKRPKVGNDRR